MELVPKTKLNAIKKLFDKNKATTTKDLEIEARFGTFATKHFKPCLDHDQFHRLMKFFTSKREHYVHTVSRQTIQYAIEGNVKKITNEATNDVHYIKKTKLSTIDVPDYGFRVSAATEEQLISCSGSFEDTTRHRTRHTFENREAALKFEVSKVVCGEGSGEGSGDVIYDIELERLPGCKFEVFLPNVNLILCILQDTSLPISVSETKKVLKLFPRKFLGIQPKTLKADFYQKEPLAVTKKLDGVRYLMTMVADQMYLVHKNGMVKKFPFKLKGTSGTSTVFSTVFDGELFHGNYHIFDVLSEKPLKSRLQDIQEFVAGLQASDQRTKIFIKEYTFTGKNDLCQLMAETVPTLDDNYDGLIIVKAERGYRDCDPLKWKKTITFDFALTKIEGNKYALNVTAKAASSGPVPSSTKYKKFGEIVLEQPVPEGVIMECFFHENKWHILKSRPDKTGPNYETVANDNWNSLQYPFVYWDLPSLESLGSLASLPPPELPSLESMSLSVHADAFVPRSQPQAPTPKQALAKKPAFYHMRRFHNFIKRHIISKSQANSVLDLACGKGGDLPKYIDSNIKTIEGYDIDADSIKEALTRKDHFLGKAICKNYSINLHQMDLLTQEVKTTVKFDLVVCNFAFHYFYNSPDCFMASILNNTRRGSTVVLSLLDSAKVKEYDTSTLNISFMSQDRVSVYIKDSVLDKPTVEYLVPRDKLIHLFKTNGFTLIKAQDFSDFYNDWKKHSNSLTDIEQEYSFMNTVYIFKKL